MVVLTVGKLKEALNDVPDNLEVRLSSDTGVDQGYDGKIIVENAYRTTFNMNSGELIDYFTIYANEVDCEEDE